MTSTARIHKKLLLLNIRNEKGIDLKQEQTFHFMKKIIASTGMVALGVIAFAPESSGQDSAKSWNLHGALRGFYDSNSTATAEDAPISEVDSFGFGVEAGVGYNLPLNQGFLGADYTYGLRWFEGRDTGDTDHSHKFNLKLDHSFSERYKVTFKDSFVFTDEPTVVDEGSAITARSKADVMRNRANLDFAAQFTPKLGATIGYENLWYDYDQGASDVAPGVASRSQLLDRMEHSVPLEGRFTLNPETVVLGGYKFSMADYASNTPYVAVFPGGPTLVTPDWRNSRSHFIYAGVEHNFTPQLNGSLRGGVQLRDYTDVPAGSGLDDSSTNPYVDGNLSYLYNPGSYVLFGYRYQSTATDLTVLDAQTHLVYLNWTHRITARLNANLTYQWQLSDFNQGFSGALDGTEDMFNIFGFNLSYSINEFLSAEAGYNFDDLDSDSAGRSYTRHIGYVGLRATY